MPDNPYKSPETLSNPEEKSQKKRPLRRLLVALFFLMLAIVFSNMVAIGYLVMLTGPRNSFLIGLTAFVVGIAGLALLLFSLTISSFLAMNFTGSTPYTSPTGVEKEMRIAIPLQSVAIVLSISAWIGSMFVI